MKTSEDLLLVSGAASRKGGCRPAPGMVRVTMNLTPDTLVGLRQIRSALGVRTYEPAVRAMVDAWWGVKAEVAGLEASLGRLEATLKLLDVAEDLGRAGRRR